MLPYSAYLRVYQPVIAFPEPLRAVWTAYAESGRRPRRVHALDTEHTEALRRMAAPVPIVAPELESPHAYVRRVDGMLYISPWETRLRSWLAAARLDGALPPRVAAAVAPLGLARAGEDFERWKRGGRPIRPHIQSSTWQVPMPWFLPFDQTQRYLSLGRPLGRTPAAAADEAGGGEQPGTPGAPGPTMAVPTRTLIYVTTMAEARRQVGYALDVLRGGAGLLPADGGNPLLGPGQVDVVARWLAEFHPGSLVELDYGGLVHLRGDAWLRADESVAEAAVAVRAMERGEDELAVAMYERLRSRWRPVRALESAN